jgi:hypothetical protein
MDTVKGVLVILVALLVAGVMLLFAQTSATKAQLEHAKDTNGLTLQLLRLQGVACTANSQDFIATSRCLESSLMQKDFKEDGFAQPGKTTNGYLIIKNVNRRVYESKSFTFLFNRKVIQQGCLIPGNIDYNVACRFDFTQFCEKGSVLEVNYTTKIDNKSTSAKIFTKNC